MPAAGAVRVRGLKEMARAFAATDRHLAAALREAEREVAEPVQKEAEERATAEIRNIGPVWGRMRIGVTRTLVYVAPKQRGVRGRSPRQRPNLAPLLMERAMLPALDSHQGMIEDALDDALGDLFKRWTKWHTP